MPQLAPIGRVSTVNSLQKQGLGVNKGGMCGRTGQREKREDRCYPVNENIGVFIQELDRHRGSATELGSSGGRRSAAVGLVRSEDGDLR